MIGDCTLARLREWFAHRIFRFNEQKQDHFDPNNNNVWSQRYFVNDSFFDGSGPVMLCCGGEGPPLTPDV